MGWQIFDHTQGGAGRARGNPYKQQLHMALILAGREQEINKHYIKTHNLSFSKSDHATIGWQVWLTNSRNLVLLAAHPLCR